MTLIERLRLGGPNAMEAADEAADVIEQLLAALKAVVAIADRRTDEFDAARAAITKVEPAPF